MPVASCDPAQIATIGMKTQDDSIVRMPQVNVRYCQERCKITTEWLGLRKRLKHKTYRSIMTA